MADEKLVEYIEQQLRKDVHPERIKRSLLEAGHAVERVEEALGDVHTKRRRQGLMIGAVAVILLFIVAMIVLNLSKDAPTTGQSVGAPDDQQAGGVTTTTASTTTTTVSRLTFSEMGLPAPENGEQEVLEEVIQNHDQQQCEMITEENLRNHCIFYAKHCPDAGEFCNNFVHAVEVAG